MKKKSLFVSLLFMPEDLFCKSFLTIQCTLGNKIKATILINICAIEFNFIDKKFAEIVYKRLEIQLIMAWSQNLVTWLQMCVNGHVILIDLDLFFAFNQTSNQTVTSTLSLPPLFFLYQLGYNFLYISTSSFWSKSFICFIEPRPSSLFDSRFARKNYLEISVFPVR